MSKVMDETEQVPLYTEATDGRNQKLDGRNLQTRAESPSVQVQACPVLCGFGPRRWELPPLSSTPTSLEPGEIAGREEPVQTEIRIKRKDKGTQWKCYKSERRSVMQ